MGDIRITKGVDPPAPKHERRRKLARRITAGALLAAAIVAAGFAIRVPRRAYAAGYATTRDYAEVRSAASGRVVEILATSGDVVEKGDPLLRLEDAAERAAVAESEGLVGECEGAVGEGEGLVAKGEAELALREVRRIENLRLHAENVKAAELDVAQAESHLELTRQLHGKGLASGRKLEDDQYSLVKAQERLRALKETDLTLEEREIEVLRRDVQTRRDALVRMRAALDRARAALGRAQAALAQRTVCAPVGGRVVRYTFYVGEMIRPDLVLYEIFGGEVDCLKLRIPEKSAGEVAAGMPLDVRLKTVRGLPPRRFPGTVEALRDVVEGTGDACYRVAYASFDPGGMDVAPGTTAEARIRTGRVSLWGFIVEP
ncbi:MAG: HlyD family secretion protein [Kiritimatiellia bacterium]|jgi:multidrug resistance efflux pump